MCFRTPLQLFGRTKVWQSEENVAQSGMSNDVGSVLHGQLELPLHVYASSQTVLAGLVV